MTLWLANCHQAWLVTMNNRVMGCVKIMLFESSVPVKVSCTVCCGSSLTIGSDLWGFCRCFSYKCRNFLWICYSSLLRICRHLEFSNSNRLHLKFGFELCTAVYKFWLVFKLSKPLKIKLKNLSYFYVLIMTYHLASWEFTDILCGIPKCDRSYSFAGTIKWQTYSHVNGV